MLILILAGLCFLGWGAIKFFESYRASKTKPRKEMNPYIEAHKNKLRNDREYDEYMEWLLKNPDTPIDKVKLGSDEMNEEVDGLKKLLNA